MRRVGGYQVCYPVAAVGFYLMGVEETKRDIELNIYLSDGSVVDASADILAL